MKYIKKFESTNFDRELHFFAANGDLTQFKKLKELGADITKYTRFLSSPLIDAVYFAKDFDTNLEICEEIIDAGADINWKNDLGETALIVSAYQPKIDIIRLLIKSGADLSIKSDSNEDFFDILNDPKASKRKYREMIFDTIKKEFPEEYEFYLTKKSAELYNI